MGASLATDIDDPLERMKAIHASTQSAKVLTEAIRARKIQSVGEVAPPLLLNLAPWEIADGIKDALAVLMDAAGLGKPTPVHDPFDR